MPAMLHAEVSFAVGANDILKFKSVFPQWAEEIVKWTPEKNGCIKVELTGKRFFIFTYVDDLTWRMETVRMNKKA